MKCLILFEQPEDNEVKTTTVVNRFLPPEKCPKKKTVEGKSEVTGRGFPISLRNSDAYIRSTYLRLLTRKMVEGVSKFLGFRNCCPLRLKIGASWFTFSATRAPKWPLPAKSDRADVSPFIVRTMFTKSAWIRQPEHAKPQLSSFT